MDWKYIWTVVAIKLSLFIIWLVGYYQGWAEALEVDKEARNELLKGCDAVVEENALLVDKHNRLVDDYNALLRQAGRGRPVPRTEAPRGNVLDAEYTRAPDDGGPSVHLTLLPTGEG